MVEEGDSIFYPTYMGASLSWYAFRGRAPEVLLRDLDLEFAETKYFKSPYSGAALPGDWFLVCHGRHEFTEREMRSRSIGCEVVACFVEEHVMVSRASCWRDGAEVWSVLHDAQEDGRHLEVRGTPPEAFDAIFEDFMERQNREDDCDYIFEIPVETANSVVGYRHDEYPDEPGTELVSLVKASRSLIGPGRLLAILARLLRL